MVSHYMTKETYIPIKSTDEDTKESPSQAAFIKEITELFEIPKDQISRSRENEHFLLDVPHLDLHKETHTVQEAFNFLFYFIDSTEFKEEKQKL